MTRFDYVRRETWKAACRLNRYPTFADLRGLYISIRGGSTYGCYSGYSP